MKKIGLFLILFGFTLTYSQTVDDSGNLQTTSRQYLKAKPNADRLQGWYISGANSLQFNQAAFSNWIAGGVNSYSLTANVDYEFNLTAGRHIWDNRVLLNYGVLRNEGEEYRKSNDVIDLTSSYGYEFIRHFYFAASANFKTQFTEGFDYAVQDSITGDYKKISNFMAPGYLSFGLGIDYKPNENLQVNFHPFTSRFTFVQDKDLQTAGSFGLKEDGDNYLYEFGAFLGARYKINIWDNISYDNRLGIYSNYLNSPFNMDVAYQGVLDLKVNNFISAQATLNLFYDEDQIQRTQVKQTLGVGLSYNFNNAEKLKLKEINLPPPPTLEELNEALMEAQKAADAATLKLQEAQEKVEEATQEVDKTQEVLEDLNEQKEVTVPEEIIND
ncbi:MAG TPA: DUF3078 domain-containing protein [Moheibacter sp.]|nr:DUF3078 domain-containing protein [Moheibacter sp.]